MDDKQTEVRVEFFGIPRQRAGVAETVVIVERCPATLADVIAALRPGFPELAAECFDGVALRAGFVASLAGRRFVDAPDTPVTGSDPLLILSADAGG